MMRVLLLLVLACSSDAANVVDRDPIEQDDSGKAVGSPLARLVNSRGANQLLGACSVGAAAAGAALCQSAGALVGGGYLAAGASGLMMTAAMRKARLAKQESDALALSIDEFKSDAAELKAELGALRGASGEIVDTLGALWESMKGGKERMAASLDRGTRLQLLRMMQTFDAEADPSVSEGELLQAEHYLLRHFPQKDMQALLLAASRAGTAHKSVSGRPAAAQRSQARVSTELLPGPPNPSCLGFRQTAGCNPLGAREAANDKECDEIVPPGVSGYCECRSVNTSKVTCNHLPFSCADICDAAAMA